MSTRAARSKFATDLMYRLWDSHRQVWVSKGSRNIWTLKSAVDSIRDQLIKEGRDPATLSVERVLVELK